jgi:Bax protein
MDIVPPSLAIAQAAIESGWGQSRFATNGNALFGQRTTNPDRGMRPAALPETTTVRVAAFGRPIESVRSYIHNLNTYPAYQAFRDRRAALRRSGGESDGLTLAGTLVAYSTRGQAYVRDLQSIIRANRLAAFDTVAPATMPGQHTSGSDT